MRDAIIATLPPVGLSNAKNLSGSKEMTDALSVVALDPKTGNLREVVTVRCYTGRSRSASTVYASIWTHGVLYTSGHGSAGGYGYCKRSAAIGDAIRSAGITLSSDINGRGMSSVREALEAIARSMGYTNILTVEH